MSIINKPLHPGHGGRSSDDLDGLLRRFFRAEMPDPWPVLKPPAEPTTDIARSAPRRWGLSASRWALAASVALLLVGQLFLSGTFTDYAAPRSEATFQDPTANPGRVKERKYKIEAQGDPKSPVRAPQPAPTK
jgi:hypothetical protein